MKQQNIVEMQFGSTAGAYLNSPVHAQGQGLNAITKLASQYPTATVLDIGCGAGHVSYAVAPMVKKVVAYDLSKQMLAIVANSAQERHLPNIDTQQGIAEQLPFDDHTFDLVLTRFSAHHWSDVPAALKEIQRVLTPQGKMVIVDVVAPECPLKDTILQTIEILRDPSHVRDYRVSEWKAMLCAAGFTLQFTEQWKLVMVFDEWIKRMCTPPVRVAAIRHLFDCASQEVLQYFLTQPDYSFSLDVALLEAVKDC